MAVKVATKLLEVGTLKAGDKTVGFFLDINAKKTAIIAAVVAGARQIIEAPVIIEGLLQLL